MENELGTNNQCFAVSLLSWDKETYYLSALLISLDKRPIPQKDNTRCKSNQCTELSNVIVYRPVLLRFDKSICCSIFGF